MSDKNKANAQQHHKAQMLNYNQLLDEAFQNWPFQTIVGQDTLTWLSQENLNEICGRLFGKNKNYVGCTNQIGATDSQLSSDTFPFTGSNTYILDSLPPPLWGDLGLHESNHHSAISGIQAMAYDATQKRAQHPKLKNAIDSIFYKKRSSLDSINRAMDKIEWLKWEKGSPPELQKHNYEPNIKQTIFDFDKAIEKLFHNSEEQ